MSWTIERSDPRPGGEKSAPDIVIKGFENGVADGATNGIQDMRGVNIISMPGQVQVSLGTSAVTIPSTITAAAVTFTGSSDVVNFTGLTLYNGMAIKFGSTSGGVTADKVYWVGSLTATTFKVYSSVYLTGSAVNLSDDSNTLTSFTFSQPKWGCNDFVKNATSSQNGFVFIQDSAGKCWWVNDSGNLVYFGPFDATSGIPITSGATGNGIVVLGDFVLAFRETKIDTFAIPFLVSSSDTKDGWTIDWKTVSAATGTTIHQAVVGRDNACYFCNVQTIGSIIVSPGATFDPTTSASFTYAADALILPHIDEATYVAELGNDLLIGGIINRVYVWDRINPGINSMMILAENYTSRIVSTNSNAYIFAGNRGRIFITNGSNVELYKKFPDSVVNVQEPYYTWGDAMYWRNQLYFGITATTNAGAAITSFGNIWAIDLTSGALRHTNYTSGGAAAPDNKVNVLLPNNRTSAPGGTGFYAGWTSTLFGTAYGVDVTSSTPYQSTSQTLINTDLIPVGTFFTGRTFSQVEYKLARELVTGESIAIGWRTNLNDNFTSLTSTSTQVGAMSGTFGNTIDPSQYLQLQVGMASTASSPSYCPLTEIRIR